MHLFRNHTSRILLRLQRSNQRRAENIERWGSLSVILCLMVGGLNVACSFKTHTPFESFLNERKNITFDIALLRGLLVDGSGQDRYEADILIDGDSIAFIGQVDTSLIEWDQIFFMDGMVVAPGLIDPHGHGDPLKDDFSNFMAMGVTTVVLGQDGRSPVIGPSKSSSRLFLDRMEGQGLQTNIAYLAGHGSLRTQFVNRARASDVQISEMTIALDSALEAGCFGLSTGLEYHPGLLADSIELHALARVVGNHQGIIMSHLRSEDDESLEKSIKELLNQGQFCKVHISHLKSVYGKGKDRAKKIISWIEHAQSQGIKITADVYPYPASYTGIGIVFPSWAKTPSAFTTALTNREYELRTHLTEVIMRRNGPEATLFASGPFVGKTLAEVASLSKQSYVDILLKLGPTGASAAYFVMDEALQEEFIIHPDIMICSDGGPTMRHPRAYGSQAKIIAKYVAQDELLSLESAIAKMSGLPSILLGISRRGFLRVGYKADLVVFDPAQVRDHATYANPFQLATGMDLVIINGMIAKVNEKMTAIRAGVLLRK